MTSSCLRASIAPGALFCVLASALLGGCKLVDNDDSPSPNCSATYTSNDVVLELGPRELVLGAACAEGSLLLRICVEGACRETDLLPAGTCDSTGTFALPEVACEGEPGGPAESRATFDLRLYLDGQAFGTHAVSLTVQSRAGEVLYQDERQITFEGRSPSGFDCGTGSTKAPPERFDLNAELAGFDGACDGAR